MYRRLSLPLYNSKYATEFTTVRYINCIERVMNCCYYNKIIYCLLSNKTGLNNTCKLFSRLTPPYTTPTGLHSY